MGAIRHSGGVQNGGEEILPKNWQAVSQACLLELLGLRFVDNHGVVLFDGYERLIICAMVQGASGKAVARFVCALLMVYWYDVCCIDQFELYPQIAQR